MSDQNIIVTITGPSLTGKTTLANLLKNFGFDEVVSTTTRPQRAGEVDGIHYNFITSESFKEMLSTNSMIEHVEVGQNFYGVSKSALTDVLNRGLNAAVVVEPNGAKQVADFCQKNNIPLYQVFINNPLDVLIERFKHRFENDSKADHKTYMTRLWGVVMEEPNTWVKRAVDGEDKYDKVFNLFTPQNEHEVVAELVSLVEKQFSKKKSKKSKP